VLNNHKKGFVTVLNNFKQKNGIALFYDFIRSIYFYALKVISMIQRIQSIYLLLTAFVAILFLHGSYLTFFDNSDAIMSLKMNGLFSGFDSAEANKIGNVHIIQFLVILIPLISILTIFLFSKRKIQMTLNKILIISIIAFICATCYYSYSIMSEYNATIDSWHKAIIPVIQLIFAVLAYRAIKKDDDLLKSNDRLR